MPSTEHPDPLAAVVPLALLGDRTALEWLCRQLQGPVFRLALRVLDDATEASDATQEILVTIVTHLSQFRGESRLLTWAYSVGTRHLLRHRRKLARERRLVALESTIRAGLSLTQPESAPDGDAWVLASETRLGCTGAMLRCLNVDERVAIVLTEVLGADDQLGARLCEVAPAVYRKRLSRARQKLRPVLVPRFQRVEGFAEVLGNSRERVSGLGGAQGTGLVPRCTAGPCVRSTHRFDGIAVLENLCGLARPDAPCSCTRQARAKQIAGVARSAPVRLPLVDAPEVQRAAEALGQVHRLGAVFALEPMVDPPETLWTQLREHLGSLLAPRDAGAP